MQRLALQVAATALHAPVRSCIKYVAWICQQLFQPVMFTVLGLAPAVACALPSQTCLSMLTRCMQVFAHARSLQQDDGSYGGYGIYGYGDERSAVGTYGSSESATYGGAYGSRSSGDYGYGSAIPAAPTERSFDPLGEAQPAPREYNYTGGAWIAADPAAGSDAAGSPVYNDDNEADGPMSYDDAVEGPMAGDMASDAEGPISSDSPTTSSNNGNEGNEGNEGDEGDEGNEGNEGNEGAQLNLL